MDRSLPSRRTEPDRQRGAALLVFMFIFFLASMSWLLSQTDTSRMRSEADRTTAKALAQAKEALIGRAVADKERPGSLPCPDYDDDGDATNGSCTSVPGRLPWRTLDLPDLRDGDGNRLWYVLTSELRDNGGVINTTVPLTLSLDGTDNIAAIVFSAGPPLAGQNGRPSKTIADYLDGANKIGDPYYVSGPMAPTFNDKVIAISHDQLFSVVNRRILKLILAELKKYYQINARYPENNANLETALSIDTENLLSKNKWLQAAVTKYSTTTDRQSAIVTINASPATSCTITPTQEPSCLYP